MPTAKKEKRLIGTTDRIDLPEFGLYDIECKIDTGAETSAIHCHRVKLHEREGKDFISFCLLDPDHPDYNDKRYETDDFKEKTIKNSFGQSEVRFVIKTDVTLFGQTFEAQFTLADRSRMIYPVLLGKRLLKGRFVVDVAQKDLSYNHKQLNT